MRYTNSIHLISFADGPFKPRTPQFLLEAKASDLFDSATVYDLEKLPSDFRRSHGAYMKNTERGFGYWIWKPACILDGLENSKPDDIFVYLDAGYTINKGGRGRFIEYIEMCQSHENKFLSFNNIFTESHWTKQDCASRVGLARSSSHLKKSQLTANFFIFSATKRNRDFLRQWSDISLERDYHFSDDTPSLEENHRCFREHRHDQSISSLLRKVMGTEVTHLETQDYKGRFDDIKHTLPMWATRLRR